MALNGYVSIKEAAKILKVSESTVRRLFDSKKLHGHRTPSGHRRLLRESVVGLESTMFDGISFPQ
jgi:excisionase family DNA binding protein